MIAPAEASLGVRFPSSYLARLMRDNGGEITTEDDDWILFPVRDDTDRKRLARTASHVVVETAKLREWPNFPPTGVAIASDGCGNALVLMPPPDRPDTLGEAIYRWDHESESQDLELVARSIDELENAG